MTGHKLSEAELEALIAIASQPAPITEKYKDLSSVDSWIIANDIKPGLERITPMRAYVAYRRWAHDPINPNDFYRLLKKRFKKKRATASKDGRAVHSIYLLNPEPFISVPKSIHELQAELENSNRERYEQKAIENTRAGQKE